MIDIIEEDWRWSKWLQSPKEKENMDFSWNENWFAGGFFTRDSRYYCTKCYQVSYHHQLPCYHSSSSAPYHCYQLHHHHFCDHHHHHNHCNHHNDCDKQQHCRQILGRSARNATFLWREKWSVLSGIHFTRWEIFSFQSFQSSQFCLEGLFHVRPMQASVSNRGASYFYRQELPLSGLYTGVVIIIIIITITIITNVIIIIIMKPWL